MAEDFYNPYQFIPATGKVGGEPTPTVDFEEIKKGETEIRHDLWLRNRKSGRIVCSLTLKTPTVVGNEHERLDTGETLVHPYRIGLDGDSDLPEHRRKGELALPANSLRGLVASVAETLSQSALRVLQEERYSVRKPIEQALSAIGMITRFTHPETGKSFLRILPLTLPTIDLIETDGFVPEKWRNAFAGRNLASCLRAYIDGYESASENDPTRIYSPGTFLEKTKPDCFHGDRPIWYYAKTDEQLLKLTVGSKINRSERGINCIAKRYVLGQLIEKPLSADTYDDQIKKHRKAPAHLLDKLMSGYQRGVLHILGIDDRDKQIPKNKKHEFFIPYPSNSKPRLLSITPKAWEDFLFLIEDRIKASKREEQPAKKLPFLPKGYIKSKDEETRGKPAPGELVYFDINEAGQVTEISYSSIWRKPIDGTIHDAFKKIDPNLLPWKFGDRTHLTPAEWIFGVVDGRKKTVKDPRSHNLASRVRFSDARGVEPEKIELLQPTMEPEKGFQLKILASPKPPSPAMYFKNGREITKTTLDLKTHRPNGRKVYLPQESGGLRWESRTPGDNLKQKVRCWPLKENQTFYFHIDFDNLSDAELELLLTALRPGEEYIHRLGLGKPLGLGCVTVRPLGVFLLDRVARYSPEALDIGARRYAFQIPLAWDKDAARLYEAESSGLLTLEKAPFDPDKSLIDPDTLDLLNTVGSLKNQKPGTGIHYPYCTPDQIIKETEGYEWFVVNDRKDICEARQRQALWPVEKGKKLEPLRPHRSPKK